tara:strand:+ start:56227 stop:57048 length:822 start_codon:yes stop_codon:yes gene_type:complete
MFKITKRNIPLFIILIVFSSNVLLAQENPVLFPNFNKRKKIVEVKVNGYKCNRSIKDNESFLIKENDKRVCKKLRCSKSCSLNSHSVFFNRDEFFYIEMLHNDILENEEMEIEYRIDFDWDISNLYTTNFYKKDMKFKNKKGTVRICLNCQELRFVEDDIQGPVRERLDMNEFERAENELKERIEFLNKKRKNFELPLDHYQYNYIQRYYSLEERFEKKGKFFMIESLRMGFKFKRKIGYRPTIGVEFARIHLPEKKKEVKEEVKEPEVLYYP